MSCKSNFITASLRILATPIFLIGAYYALQQLSWSPLVAVALLPVIGNLLALVLPAEPVAAAQAKRTRLFQNVALGVFVALVVLAAITNH